ncbi:ABC transporter [Salipiger aestuarii]|uniref:Nucleoside ABC transporter ATP-binding protein n=1 Tax=Salipiger aestuarii TaxID=568098 RepID=A0A327YL33_9RHOB|nr:ABC transporter ATP-binding protein [Salipiger aestuarii]EIE53079.1 sugar ABC transporter, ATP-binding protein [Citreicella sp. 357]KAA8608735.1 ABC transporter [Salipiger aestuarii]KAA8613033.1 ABC transporter [Salipiger aestuarii]KAB2542501.1 ABC transporter [Salipiger aestuarii]RAK18969.1 nucleoside ABC transporter ATP-binding protein [Salipiger aestuarii]
MPDTLLSLRGLTKTYPGVVANDDVSFDIGKSEIHALLGENGAGKSTLVKMIFGLVKPDRGEMRLDGDLYSPGKPSEARKSGVAMVFQHFSLFNALDVAENVALGMESPPAMRDLARQIRAVSETYGLPLDPSRVVGTLSAGERQRVEIIRCLLQGPRLLIMDEPTSVLTPQEVGILFQTLNKLKSEGTSILYISHKLEEIRTLCDEATILRLGKNVGTCTPRDVTARQMAEMMVGSSFAAPEPKAGAKGEVLLRCDALSMPAPGAFGTPLREISVEVRGGEVLGIGGVAGNGQDELLMALSGERLAPKGTIWFKGRDVGRDGPSKRREAGLLSGPEERLGHAAAPNMSLTENAVLTGARRKRLVKNGFIDWTAAQAFADHVIARYDVRTPGADVTARSLSGGNLQKFVVGREIEQDPDVFVVNQPTWGVDAAAAAAIRQALLDLAARGAAIICISQDLDELMEISDRFGALNEGRLSPTRAVADLDIEKIGLMMGGAHDMEVVHADG